MKKFLLLGSMIVVGVALQAQSPTLVTPANNCSVFRNFNASDEGFSSPSIYSNSDDVAFDWNAVAGAEVESSGLIIRSASLISPIFIQTDPANVTIGFRYEAPLGTQYRIRVISAVSSAPLEILATSSLGPVYTTLPATSGNICVLFTDADLTVGKQVRFEITFRANQAGPITFDDLSLSVSAGPLPVTFEGFVARQNADASIKLLWNVGTEINVAGYYLQSSTDGLLFTNVGYVTATGQSIYSLDYLNKLVQTTFFRVKNVDVDGNSKYTTIIKVYAKDQTGATLQLYPLPARNQVTVQHSPATQNTLITLVGNDGKKIQQVRAKPNTLQTQINTSRLASGLYFILYEDGVGGVQSIKLVKN